MRLDVPTKRQRHESAFTIPEVVIAAVLLAFSWIALNSAITNAYMIVRSARENLRATQIMVEKTEQLRMYNWNQILALTSVQSTNYFDPSSNTPPVYTVTVSAPQIPANLGAVSYQNDMRTFIVSVSWYTYNGKTNVFHTDSMQTHVAHLGMNSYVGY